VFRIKSDETKEITVANRQEASTAGSLLVIKKSEGGKPLSGAVFGVYDAATREKLDEITTDRYGEAVLELEAGGYFLRELKAPQGMHGLRTRWISRLRQRKQKKSPSAISDWSPNRPKRPLPAR
jgi:hypothetical protein